MKILRVYETDLETGEQQPKPAGSHIPLEPDELIASGRTSSAPSTQSCERRGRRRRRPPVASARRYLRRGLPAIYHDDDFGMRFVGALETLLDPIVGILDNLPAHFDADSRRRTSDLLAAWLGVELDESWSEDRQRELVQRQAELARRRGTRRASSWR